MNNELSNLLLLVNSQAEDLILWQDAATDRESALQEALRTLHYEIEQAAGVTDGSDS